MIAPEGGRDAGRARSSASAQARRNEIQIRRNKIQIQRNKIKARRNKIKVSRNKIKIGFLSANRDFSVVWINLLTIPLAIRFRRDLFTGHCTARPPAVRHRLF